MSVLDYFLNGCSLASYNEFKMAIFQGTATVFSLCKGSRNTVDTVWGNKEYTVISNLWLCSPVHMNLRWSELQ